MDKPENAVDTGSATYREGRKTGHTDCAYMVIGLVAAIGMIASVAMLPEFVRYMKIRGM